MNNWLLTKICTFLTNREGCEVFSRNHGSEEDRVVLQDAMGFRYEVSVRLLGKNIMWTENDVVTLTKDQVSQIEKLA